MDLDIVIVTYNRLEKLKKALLCYEQQTASFRNLILVDNCSTDGTKEYLDKWKQQKAPFQKVVIHAEENLGGSGGFYLGQKKAMELGADWVFVADDDAYAATDMIEQFYCFIEENRGLQYSAICGEVINTDGSICLTHRANFVIKPCKYIFRQNSSFEDYQKRYFQIDILSYVGSFLNVHSLRKTGLVNPLYFIYFDDTEHSFRLKKTGNIVCVPAIKIVHESAASSTHSNSEIVVSWRDYYQLRNEMHMILKHKPIIGIRILARYFRKTYLSPRKLSSYDKVKSISYLHAVFNILGKNKKYSPGWEIKTNIAN